MIVWWWFSSESRRKGVKQQGEIYEFCSTLLSGNKVPLKPSRLSSSFSEFPTYPIGMGCCIHIYIYMYMGFQNSEMVFICGINHEEHMGISFMTVSDY
jgi:hypothetical protein